MPAANRKVAVLGRLLCRPFVFACLASLLLFSQGAASAGTVLVFGQNEPGDPIVFHGPPGQVNTQSIHATAVPITITELGGVAVSTSAFFNMTATSTTAASVSGSVATQTFSGSFSITSGSSGTGTNYLTGTWSNDTFFGIQGGTSGSLTVSQPPGTLSFTSSVLSANQLDVPRSFSIAFSGISPELHATNGNNLGNYHSAVAANFSAVPEPGSLVLMSIAGTVVFYFGGMRRFLRRKSGQS